MKLFVFFCSLLGMANVSAQVVQNTLRKGNEWYNKQDYGKAAEQYELVIEKEPNNFTAAYNKAAALFKLKKFEAAAVQYEQLLKLTTNPLEKSAILYNQANALVQMQQYATAVANYKAVLKQNPNDADARYNLTKAMAAMKKQQKQKEQPNKKNKDPEDSPKQKPKNNDLKMDQVLQMLRRKEKNVQDRLQKEKQSGVQQPEKDW